MKLQNSLPTLDAPLFCTGALFWICIFSPLNWKLRYFCEPTLFELGWLKVDFVAQGTTVILKVSTGFWLQTRETAAVLILIAVAQIAIWDISLLEDFVQSISPLTVSEWWHGVFWWGYWGCKITNVCLHKLSLLVWFFLLSEGMWHFCQNHLLNSLC